MPETTKSIGIPSTVVLGFLDKGGEISSEDFLSILRDYDAEFRKVYGESYIESRFRNGLDAYEKKEFFGLNYCPEIKKEYQRALLEYCEINRRFHDAGFI